MGENSHLVFVESIDTDYPGYSGTVPALWAQDGWLDWTWELAAIERWPDYAGQFLAYSGLNQVAAIER